jgi:hypothetical protein
MRWAGEPKLEEVLSDPIVRAVMARDRVDLEGLRLLLRNATKLLALRGDGAAKRKRYAQGARGFRPQTDISSALQDPSADQQGAGEQQIEQGRPGQAFAGDAPTAEH